MNIGAYANHNIIAYNYTPQGAIEGWFNEGYNIENKSFDTIGHRKALLSYTTTGADFGYAGDIAYGLIKSQGTTDLPCVAILHQVLIQVIILNLMLQHGQ